MKTLLFSLISLLMTLSLFAQEGITYKSNDAKTEMYYDEILEFEGLDKNTLLEEVKKTLLIKKFTIHFEDEDEIYATGNFETLYRGWFLFMFNTKKFDCVYDLKVSFKDEKIRYEARDFILLYKNYSVRTTNWLSGSGAGFSTTKIPADIPKKPVNSHFKAKKTSKKHLLFQSIDANMNEFHNSLIGAVTSEKEDW